MMDNLKLIMGGIAAAILAFGAWLIRKGGRDAEKADQVRRNEVSRQKAEDVERRVDRADDSERQRLRDRWTPK